VIALARADVRLAGRRDWIQRTQAPARAPLGRRFPVRVRKEIVEAMNAVGRVETYNGVSVYLDMLLKAGRVIRVSRGRYVAAEP
jgi:hypothetical protein